MQGIVHSSDLWNAWSKWWDGQEIKEEYLLGFQIIWWGRFGKFLQFLGGAVVIVDLVGAERFQRAAASVRNTLDLAADVLIPKMFIYFVFPTGVTMVVLRIIENTKQTPRDDVISSGPIWVTVLVFGFAVAVCALITATADRILLLLAAIVELGKRQHLLKWISFVLVVVGFFFDLAGS